MLLAYAADSLAVAAQGLIGDRVGAGMVPGAREVAGRVSEALLIEQLEVNGYGSSRSCRAPAEGSVDGVLSCSSFRMGSRYELVQVDRRKLFDPRRPTSSTVLQWDIYLITLTAINSGRG